ncbi:hypothetical protein A3860_34245 [Niastella vici]|uniref:Haem-binding domain-containing protein n=1 Tax=Niastella vici TaxID=1703345 RepID=A0A1V9FP75_9BACT|nr:hypothetical protein A3860_34245 [Niastella vici]
MKRLKKILLGLLIVFLLIQFIQPDKNINRQEQSTDLVKTVNVPYNIQVILKNSCYDCHSNSTRYPWYARVQPLGWLLANHIREGKAELNFNEFGSYALRRQISKLNGIGCILFFLCAEQSYIYLSNASPNKNGQARQMPDLRNDPGKKTVKVTSP